LSRPRRATLVALAVWWLSILVLLPTGRPIVTALRDRGLLALGVTLGIAAVAGFVFAGGWRLHRRGVLTPMQWRVALAMTAILILAVQFLPRFEERWHCVQYSILGGLLWAVLVGRSRRLVLAVAIAVALGWLDEGVQLLLPDRVYDWWDVALNAASGAAGVALVEVTERVGLRGRQPRRMEA